MFKYSMTKTITEITARQTRTSLCKLDVIKVWSMAYLTTQIELVLPTFFQILDRSQNYTEYLTLGLLSSRWNIYRSTTVYFFWPTLYVLIHPTPDSPTLKMAGSQSVSHHLFCLLEPVRTGSVTKGRLRGGGGGGRRRRRRCGGGAKLPPSFHVLWLLGYCDISCISLPLTSAFCDVWVTW